MRVGSDIKPSSIGRFSGIAYDSIHSKPSMFLKWKWGKPLLPHYHKPDCVSPFHQYGTDRSTPSIFSV